MKREAENNVHPAHQERSRDKRDRLIRAGLSVFARCGYHQTRMTDVAAEAGVSVGVLYQRFKDKRAFFEVIVDTLAERLEQGVNDFFEAADDAWSLHELVARVIETLVEVVERDVGFFLALVTVGDDVPGAISRIAATDRLRARRFHAFAIRGGLIDRAVDEETVFFALATAIRMLLVTATVDRDPVRLRNPETRSQLAAMLTGYLQRG